ncbi:hypothetical protein AB0J14_38650 [Micromonospora arborensis]|uniref:hypothetical protein n=1 Tax=Micromonospora arborensis TaxID=2116518 RepID=UPI00340228A8
MAITPGGGVYRRLRHRLAASARVRRIGALAWRVLARLDSPLRRWVAVGVLIVLLGGTSVVASAGFGTATAEDAQLAGRPVPAGQLEAVAAAAHACPVLTPARLAGQLMAASGFDANAKAANGGTEVAGLTDAAWDRWKPAPTSQRSDPAANITALAHLTCDLVGQVRQAGIGGDLWRLALGAYHSGVAAVRAAKGVPQAATGYVNQVSGYAAWYARRPGTGTSSGESTGPIGVVPSSGTDAKPVPDVYLAAVLAAGRSCPALSPGRVAAQLMASSGFNPNLLGAHSAQGIAQFNPQVWARYAPSPSTTSPWDPSVAVPSLGLTMCALVGELSGMEKDPYPLALAAFRVGPDAVRRAGGVPDDAGLRDYIKLVTGYVSHYQQDPRLGGKPAGVPSPTATPRPGVKPSTPVAQPGGGSTPGGTTSGGSTPGQHTPGGASPSRPAQTRPTTSAPKPDWQTLVVQGTSVLKLNQSWRTNRLNFVLASDGNVLLYDQGKLVWQTRTGGKGGDHLVFQGDGHLVLYSKANATLWSSGTAGNNGAILVLQADGNVTISIGGRGLWHTGTANG